jgi:soluble lytic murein transglycosylase-like protein
LVVQRSSLRHQVTDNSFVTALGISFDGKPRPLFISAPPCAPLPVAEREHLISSAAEKEAIDPDLLRAVMHHESGFRPCAVSIKGAVGLMQLMPATIAQFHVSDAFDPGQSVHAGAALLRSLLERYQGDLPLTLAAYNAGAGRVENADPGSYPNETKNYVADILAELGTALQRGN